MADVTVERTFDASPEQAWALVSDPTRYGEWSPESTGASWSGGASGPAVGAKFKGTNERGKRQWSTTCTVTKCDAPRQFEFDVTVGPLPIATWGFRITPTDGGCTVAEYWTNNEPRVFAIIANKALGVDDRAELNRTNMAATLDAMAASLA